ncbi:hypothetical protein QLL95_gp1290 [Cotonvirus japonicus]|uniref:Bro-N domain-containing protein n=1 Tax=Cotonvirus japonicus TaxID=2811091 RepID=A0ABM7NRP2_9VIRU|nr:hypothetical protein QLL95_gp1290 [Cotonvirus japonicus]BCS82833.1 hypothetical protein [Cotonvirus japonicus]
MSINQFLSTVSKFYNFNIKKYYQINITDVKIMSVITFLTEFKIPHKTIEKQVWFDVYELKKILVTGDKLESYFDEMFLDERIKFLGEKCFANVCEINAIVEQLNCHPEHYNAKTILGLKCRFKKKQEIETLAIIYDHYRNKYNMSYQHPELEFRMDMNMVIEIGREGGLCVEIDENGHNNYDKINHEDRQKILESCGYYFVRIKPGELDKDEIIGFIDKEINNYQIMYSANINPEVLWLEVKDKGIDKKFFDLIGKSIVCNKKFCVDFDDVVRFTEYTRKNNAKRYLLENFRNEIDFVSLKKSEIENRDDVLLLSPEQQKTRGGSNRDYIYMTKFAFYSFVLAAGTRKSKEIRMQVLEIYRAHRNIIMGNINKSVISIDNRLLKYGDTSFNFIIDIDNNIWFIAKQIALFLGYNDPKKAVSIHVDVKYKKKLSEIKIKGNKPIENFKEGGKNYPPKKKSNSYNQQNSIYINESGLYQLLATCKTKNDIAKKFKEWLYEEVLPEIRKTGGYFKRKYDKINYNFGEYYGLTVIYLLYICDNYYKFGITDGLDKRLKTHKTQLNYKEIVRLWKVDNFSVAKKIENLIKDESKNIGISTTYNKKTEIIKTNESYDINYVIDDLIQKNINIVTNNDKNIISEINTDMNQHLLIINKQLELEEKKIMLCEKLILLEKEKQKTIDKQLSLKNNKNNKNNKNDKNIIEDFEDYIDENDVIICK